MTKFSAACNDKGALGAALFSAAAWCIKRPRVVGHAGFEDSALQGPRFDACLPRVSLGRPVCPPAHLPLLRGHRHSGAPARVGSWVRGRALWSGECFGLLSVLSWCCMGLVLCGSCACCFCSHGLALIHKGDTVCHRVGLRSEQ